VNSHHAVSRLWNGQQCLTQIGSTKILVRRRRSAKIQIQTRPCHLSLITLQHSQRLHSLFLIFTSHSELHNVLFFGAVCDFFCLCMKYHWNRSTDLCQIHSEDVFGPSLRRVSMSRSTVKVTRDKFPPHLKCTAMHSLKIMSFSSRRDHSVNAGR